MKSWGPEKRPDAFGGWRQSSPAGTQDGCGVRGHGGWRPRLGAWGICQPPPANFKVRGEGHVPKSVSSDTAPTVPKGRSRTSHACIRAAAGEDSEPLLQTPQTAAILCPLSPSAHLDPVSSPGQHLTSLHR